MAKKQYTIVNELLFKLYAAGEVLSVVFASPYEWRRKALFNKSFNSYKNTVYNLQKRGIIKLVESDGRRFLKLTKHGELEVLLAKARIPVSGKWDGKWRIMIFDIPEDNKAQRNQFRKLLSDNNFIKLQASVYVNPYPLNREAVAYLYKTGLNKFIRIIKAEEIDNDKDLRKRFNLK